MVTEREASERGALSCFPRPDFPDGWAIATHRIPPPRTAVRAMMNTSFIFIKFQLLSTVGRCLCADGGIPAIHGHKNSVEPTKAAVTGSGHTAGVRRNESDKPGAIPREERGTHRNQGRSGEGRDKWNGTDGQQPGDHRRGGGQKLDLGA